MVNAKMPIDSENHRKELTKAFVALLDAKRGVASELSTSVGKTASFANGVKRGKPVNALHLKAVGIVFGPQKVLELLSLGDIRTNNDVNFKNQTHGRAIINRLIELEKINPKVFDMVATYITGAHEAAKATADKWDGIERRSRERRSETKEDLGFKSQKNGTDE